MKKEYCLIAVLTVLLAIDIYQLLVYQNLVPKLVWSVDTLKINYDAMQQLYAACKKSMVQM